MFSKRLLNLLVPAISINVLAATANFTVFYLLACLSATVKLR